MSNEERALKWAALGLDVFPCYPEDTWVGQKLHEKKTPIPVHGLDDATRDPEVIRKYWGEFPQYLVGVVAGDDLDVLDIDMNFEKGKDGWNSLLENGIEVPTTFNVKTQGGGEHHIYRNTEKTSLGPAQDLKIESGVKLEGVDRRSGRSYFIAWSDEVPESLAVLAPTPSWMRFQGTAPSLSMFKGSVRDWEDALVKGVPSGAVVAAMERIPEKDFGHGEMLTRQSEMVMLGASGEAGVDVALAVLKEAWLRPPYNTGKYERDWEIALTGAVNKFGGGSPKTPEDLEDKFQEMVKRYFIEEKAKLEAKRLILSESFVGSDELTWDDLEMSVGSYIVQDLLPDDSICFLVAKRNMGKTFAYIDMACSIASGRAWLGKPTRQVPITIVIGEGLNGFVNRVKAWCSFNGVDFEDIKPWFSFIDGANLNNDSSLERIKAVAEKHRSELIVFDTWSNVSGTPNEDDAAMNAMILNAAKAIKSETALLFIHHPRKSDSDGERPIMRGSGVLDGRAEVVMTLFKDKDFKPTSGVVETWLALSTEMDHAGKNRGAATETIRGLYVTAHSDSAVFTRDISSAMSAGAARAFYNLKGEMTVTDYGTKIAKSASTARRDLQEAVAQGVAYEVEGAGNIGTVYGLVNEPEVKETNYVELLELAENAKPRRRKGK